MSTELKTKEMDDAAMTTCKATYSFPVEITESADAFMLAADLPGLEDRDVDVTVDKGVLTIRGEDVDETGSCDCMCHEEYETGIYERSFGLPDGMDIEGIKATMKHGVLTVTLPKHAHAKAAKIEVKGA